MLGTMQKLLFPGLCKQVWKLTASLVLSFLVMAANDASSALQAEFLLLSLLPFCFMYPKPMLGLVWCWFEFLLFCWIFFPQTKVIKSYWNCFFFGYQKIESNCGGEGVLECHF